VIPHNRYNKPVAPLSGEYHLPAPPRHSIPGTKTAKEKAGHVFLSVLCSVVFVWVFLRTNSAELDRCFSFALLPLGFGVLWGLVPLVQDWLITINLARHSATYHNIHTLNAEELRAVSYEWSTKHNGAQDTRQRIELQRRAKEERLEAENRRLLQALTKARGGVWDLDTEHLEDLEP
jgi:hypothetical protein